MGAWAGKYVIGLTGNIAVGKSVVRKMLEHVGAYGIDADALAHRAIMKGSPGYQSTIEAFGKWILAEDGQIDRAKLGKVVFANSGAMAALEEIVHPLVRQAVDVLARRVKQRVIVIEAIKLLETDLHTMCDQIWVTQATPQTQLARLVRKRKMTPVDAQQRIDAQPLAKDKLKAADVVIENSGTFEETWNQVSAAWKSIPKASRKAVPSPKPAPPGQLTVERATPKHADLIASFITQQSTGERRMTRSDVMAAFGEKAFLLLRVGGEVEGLLGWQVENLITRVDDVILNESVSVAKALNVLVKTMETASRELQSEAALLFLAPIIAQHESIWRDLGYKARTVKDLKVRAWQNAAMESMLPGTVLFFKRLRTHRILRPM
ncbi:MAG: dephospho-CoA kinase [Chloroflexota bacterium]|nr:dephospho-CoA kinase [Chloroflexota bacterium]